MYEFLIFLIIILIIVLLVLAFNTTTNNGKTLTFRNSHEYEASLKVITETGIILSNSILQPGQVKVINNTGTKLDIKFKSLVNNDREIIKQNFRYKGYHLYELNNDYHIESFYPEVTTATADQQNFIINWGFDNTSSHDKNVVIGTANSSSSISFTLDGGKDKEIEFASYNQTLANDIYNNLVTNVIAKKQRENLVCNTTCGYLNDPYCVTNLNINGINGKGFKITFPPADSIPNLGIAMNGKISGDSDIGYTPNDGKSTVCS